ncbi:hypothetical protein Tco_1066933 [Tanacetum coccineum]|uniref:Uncharacterized protein n=1 Tax=Tanacetum coccineum TaxID=301880 RepID=A0ABQ5HBG6_9ASTR
MLSVVSREESRRGLHPGSLSGSKVQPAAFVFKSNSFKSNDFKRNSDNTNRGPNPNLLCNNNGLIGHTVERNLRLTDYVVLFDVLEINFWSPQVHPPYKFKWAKRTIPVAEGSSETTTEGYMENYKNVSEYIKNLLNAKAEAVHIILTGIDNYI